MHYINTECYTTNLKLRKGLNSKVLYRQNRKMEAAKPYNQDQIMEYLISLEHGKQLK